MRKIGVNFGYAQSANENFTHTHIRFIVVILHKILQIACGSKCDFTFVEKADKCFFSKMQRLSLCNLTVYETVVENRTPFVFMDFKKLQIVLDRTG